MYDLSADDFPLNEISRPDWEKEYNELLATDVWLRKKYNRQVRLKSKIQYVEKFLADELRGRLSGWVVDIGSGPGEFLEVVERLGHRGISVDGNLDGAGGMGTNYQSLARLLHERQRINVTYCGLDAFVRGTGPRLTPSSVWVVNSQGSIEQALSRHMDGPPHDTHQDCMKLAWRIDDELRHSIAMMFGYFAHLIKPHGCFFCYANGSLNHDAFYEEMDSAALATGVFKVQAGFGKSTIRKYKRNGERSSG